MRKQHKKIVRKKRASSYTKLMCMIGDALGPASYALFTAQKNLGDAFNATVRTFTAEGIPDVDASVLTIAGAVDGLLPHLPHTAAGTDQYRQREDRRSIMLGILLSERHPDIFGYDPEGTGGVQDLDRAELKRLYPGSPFF